MNNNKSNWIEPDGTELDSRMVNEIDLSVIQYLSEQICKFLWMLELV